MMISSLFFRMYELKCKFHDDFINLFSCFFIIWFLVQFLLFIIDFLLLLKSNLVLCFGVWLKSCFVVWLKFNHLFGILIEHEGTRIGATNADVLDRGVAILNKPLRHNALAEHPPHASSHPSFMASECILSNFETNFWHASTFGSIVRVMLVHS